MIKKTLLAAVFAIALGFVAEASAQTPTTPSATPTPSITLQASPSATTSTPLVTGEPSPSATLAAETGRTFVLTVLGADGKSVPDGTKLLFFEAESGPPPIGATLPAQGSVQPCATTIVSNGSAQAVAQFNAGCPRGSQIAVLISRPEGLITAAVLCNKEDMGPCAVSAQCGGNTCQPWLDGWEVAATGEAPLHLTIMAIPPNDSSGTIQPPATGDASLAAGDNSQGPMLYVAFGVAMLLAVTSVSLVLIKRKRV